MESNEIPDDLNSGELDDPVDDESIRSPRFGRLLVIIAASFIISGFDARWAEVFVAALNVALIVVAFRTTSLRSTMPMLAALAGLAVLAMIATAFLAHGSEWRSVPAFAQCVLMAVLIVALLQAVLRRPVVDAQTIIGAISAYALMGLAYGWLYLGIDIIDDNQLSMPSTAVTQFPDFSYVVLTTLGFGNQLPTATLSARIVATEAMIGQIFLATFVARLVALYGRRVRGRSSSRGARRRR